MATGLFGSSVNLPRPARRGGSGGGRFKTRDNSVSLEGHDKGELIRLKSCRCWSRACRDCSPVLGRRVQYRLLEGSTVWAHPRLLTLTVDRSRFESPEAAYKFITEGRYLSRLMENLGVSRWVRVLEFQMATWDEKGRGWPHWHFMIDKSGRRGFVDYKRAWALWRDTWGIGGVDVTSQKKMEGRPTADIIRYLCKYMVKYPPEGFPSWVLDLNNVRFLQASRSVGALVNVSQKNAVDSLDRDPVVEGECEGSRSRLFARPLRERLAGCGEVASMFAVDAAGKEKYFSRIAVRVGQVAIAGKMGLIEGVEFEMQSDGYGKQFLSVGVRRLGGETVEELEHRVREGVALLLHLEGSHLTPPSYKQEGGGDSESVASDRASVTATLALWQEWRKAGTLFAHEGEAMEGAIAEADDAYLWELIEQEQRRTMPSK